MVGGSDAAGRELRFVRRADWSDEDCYPNEVMSDATLWAWEFLRRSRAYERDFAKWGTAYADVPAKPLDDTPVSSYICEPPPLIADMPYSEYSKAYPEHVVVSVKDFVRLRWGLLDMPDPRLAWEELFRANRDRLPNDGARFAWLFAGNALEVIREPAVDISDAMRPTFVTVACAPDEVLVRLSLRGNPDKYRNDLHRELAKFFVGGSRRGALRLLTYGNVTVEFNPETGEKIRMLSLDPDGSRWPDAGQVEILETSWSESRVRQVSLQRVLRISDLLADFERGELNLSRRNRNGRIDQVRVAPASSFRALARAIDKHIAEGNFFKKTKSGSDDPRAVLKWLADAEEMICHGHYLRLAQSSLSYSREL